MKRQLFRSRKNKVMAGVCGGIAEYFNIDPTLMRIAVVAGSLVLNVFLPTVIVAYIIAAVIMPEGENAPFGPGGGENGYENYKTDSDETASSTDDFSNMEDEWKQPPSFNANRNRNIIGITLVGLGLLFLFRQIFGWWFDLKYVIPLLMVAIGGYIIFRGRRN